jgi:hypothetical protein
VELAGERNADVVGARLTLEVGDRVLTRFAKAGGSYLSSGDRRHLFGLSEAARAGRLTVVWPSGREQHWDGLAVDRYWRLVEGDPAAQEARGGAAGRRVTAARDRSPCGAGRSGGRQAEIGNSRQPASLASVRKNQTSPPSCQACRTSSSGRSMPVATSRATSSQETGPIRCPRQV